MEGRNYTGFWMDPGQAMGSGQMTTVPMPPLSNTPDTSGTTVVRYISKDAGQKKKGMKSDGTAPKHSGMMPMTPMMQQPVNPYGSMYMPTTWGPQYGYPYQPVPVYGPPQPYGYPMPGQRPMMYSPDQQYPLPTPAWTSSPQTATAPTTAQRPKVPAAATSNIQSAK